MIFSKRPFKFDPFGSFIKNFMPEKSGFRKQSKLIYLETPVGIVGLAIRFFVLCQVVSTRLVDLNHNFTVQSGIYNSIRTFMQLNVQYCISG